MSIICPFRTWLCLALIVAMGHFEFLVSYYCYNVVDPGDARNSVRLHDCERLRNRKKRKLRKIKRHSFDIDRLV